MAKEAPKKKPSPRARSKALSEREVKILILICKEMSPVEISKRLSISEKTFFNHRANIISKTKAKGNIGLFKFALRNGYAKF